MRAVDDSSMQQQRAMEALLKAMHGVKFPVKAPEGMARRLLSHWEELASECSTEDSGRIASARGLSCALEAALPKALREHWRVHLAGKRCTMTGILTRVGRR